MELKQYLRILKRRWPALVVLPLIVVIVSAIQSGAGPTTYLAEARLRVINEQLPGDYTDYPEDDNYITSEYVIDDLTQALTGNVFAGAVSERLTAAGVQVDPEAVQRAITVTRDHRILTIDARSTDHDHAMLIAQSAATELAENGIVYLGRPAPDSSIQATIVQFPEGATPDVLRQRLMSALLVLAAIGMGLVLMMLWEHLDDRLRDDEEVAALLESPLIASIPAEKRS